MRSWSGRCSTLFAGKLLELVLCLFVFRFLNHSLYLHSDGTRLDCCFKNIGVRKYAFNRIQLATYPRKFRPPKGTYYNTVLESAAQT